MNRKFKLTRRKLEERARTRIRACARAGSLRSVEFVRGTRGFNSLFILWWKIISGCREFFLRLKVSTKYSLGILITFRYSLNPWSGRNIRRMYLELDFFPPPLSIRRIPRRWFGCVLCAIRNLFDSYILYRSYRRERYVDTIFDKKRKRLRKKRLSLNGIERYCFTKKKWWFHDRRYI